MDSIPQLLSMKRLRSAAMTLKPETSLHAILYDAIGANRHTHMAVAMLERLIEWNSAAYGGGRDGWLYKSAREWYEELRLGKNDIPRGAELLAAAGVESTVAPPVTMGTGRQVSPTRHFRIDPARFLTRFAEACGVAVDALIAALRGDLPELGNQSPGTGKSTSGNEDIDNPEAGNQSPRTGKDQSLDSIDLSSGESIGIDDALRAGWKAVIQSGALMDVPLKLEGDTLIVTVANTFQRDALNVQHRAIRRGMLAALERAALEMRIEVVPPDEPPVFTRQESGGNYAGDYASDPPERTVFDRLLAGMGGQRDPDKSARYLLKRYGEDAIKAVLNRIEAAGDRVTVNSFYRYVEVSAARAGGGR